MRISDEKHRLKIEENQKATTWQCCYLLFSVTERLIFHQQISVIWLTCQYIYFGCVEFINSCNDTHIQTALIIH